MGFFDFSKIKEVEGAESQSVSEAVETAEDSEMETKEMETMPETKSKRKFMYLALDENRTVVLDEKMQPIVSNITEENAPINWPECVGKYAKRVVSDPALRVEVPDLSPEIRDKKEFDKKAAKRKVREDAKEKLFQLADEKISEAKKKKSGSSVENKTTDVQSESQQENISQEKSNGKAGQVVADDFGSDMSSEQVNADEEKTEIPGDKAKDDGNGDTREIVSVIDKLGEQINQDINDAVEDILGTIAENDKDLSLNIKKTVQEQGRNIDATTKICIEDAINIIGQKMQKAAEDVSRRVNDAGRGISESQDKIISKVNTMGKRMSDIAESVEGIEGNLTRLDQLDEIADLLRDKGLNVSMEIPPVNAEEEDIINLVRYSQKITEQLGYAARDLIRKRETFKNQAESNENEQKVMAQRIAAARQEGIAEGKLQVVRQLLSKYEDVDAIKDSTVDYVHVIWTMLTELGVVIDGDGFYEKGREIELSDADIERMMAVYSQFDGAGKYRVVKTGLSLYGEIISAAQFSKVTEEDKQDGDFNLQTGGRQRETESDESKLEANQEASEETV